MTKSMTGYGKSEATIGNTKITAEIRSLNSKQLDLNIRIPNHFRQVEYDIRPIIAKELVRGKIDLSITVEASQVETSTNIDTNIFRSYAEQMRQAATAAGFELSADTIAQSIMRLPDVVTTSNDSLSDQEQKALLQLVADAAARLNEFREQEGAILIKDLLGRIDKIEAYKEQVEPYEKARIENIKGRIRESIAKLQVDVDSNRLEQEMIFYVEKLDITEEKVRLKNHCKYFREVAQQEECAGRKLGFISQELGREINTMGSKANDTDIQILVVKMKDELEKIKEQALNIL